MFPVQDELRRGPKLLFLRRLFERQSTRAEESSLRNHTYILRIKWIGKIMGARGEGRERERQAHNLAYFINKRDSLIESMTLDEEEDIS